MRIPRSSKAVNVMIIVCAAFIIGFFGILVFNKFEKSNPVLGSQLNIPNVDWSGNSRSLVMALQTTCHYCNESMPFYRRLESLTNGTNIRVIATFPQTRTTGTEHLKKAGITNFEVRQVDLESLKVSATPTVFLVNSKGEAIKFWVGKLSPDQEAELIKSLSD